MTVPSTAEYATEYFVSYYSCELDHCNKATYIGHECLKCPDACEHWQPRSRCRLGSMTEEEVEDFQQKSCIGKLPDYLLQSVNDLSFGIKTKREEHIQVRENFECSSECDGWFEEKSRMRELQYDAAVAVEPRRKMETQYREPTPILYFINSQIAGFFYNMEIGIVENAITHTRRA